MTNKPRLLDLFCGAGGCSMGYYRAGFEVVGVDIKPQPHYPFEFVQADAMTFPLDGFDYIHASDPCQHYTRMLANRPWLQAQHPDLIGETRKRLVASGKPWIIENVPGSPLFYYFVLCGSMFGLKIRRHRHFETSHYMMTPGPCRHNYRAIQVVGHAGKKQNFIRAEAEEAMGIDWMTKKELVQAIPPVYTEWIGQQWMDMSRSTRHLSRENQHGAGLHFGRITSF